MRLELQGKRFGRLIAIEPAGKDYRNNVLWRCICDCGKEKDVPATKLKTGKVMSCGCLIEGMRGKRSITHGMWNTRLWKIWSGMKGRCAKTKGKDFHNYKERGITVCDEWKKFEAFRDWALANGYADNLTIERVDGSKGYSPDNCAWKTWTEQARNRRNNTWVTINGVTRTLIEWSEINGIPYHTVTCRIQRGWDTKEAVTRPIQVHKRRGA